MSSNDMHRRDILAGGGAMLAGLAMAGGPSFPARAFPSRPGEVVVPWADPPPPIGNTRVVPRLLDWEKLDAWLTPNEQFFVVAHYGVPQLDPVTFRLEVGGLVARPLSLGLDQIRARPRREVVFTLECSGNHGTGIPWLTGAIGNARWAGTPLAPMLEEAGLREGGTEVVFLGADTGEEQVRDIKVRVPFGRSMSVADATNSGALLCYEMNGAPLPREHGFPLRLIVPGWYGVANVKWLDRIEVWDRRYMGRYMARDYVTIREERRGDATLITESSVGRARLKSAPAQVTRLGAAHRVLGAAWGAPIARVEVRIDGGPWAPATLDRSETAEFAWTLWTLDWPNPSPGEHSITSRAVDAAGRMQPAMDDPEMTGKRTYWETNGQVTRRIRIG